MRGGVRVDTPYGSGFDGERASQIELRLRDAYRVAPSIDVLAGIRYLNFAAAYVADQSLADRNRGVLATVGLLARVGKR
jgi:hypothetical protein